MKRFLIVFIIVAILLAGCSTSDDVITKGKSETLGRYSIVYIEGMPCISIYTSLSCDWSQWEGKD